ncbi:hypothetical protein GCM10010357_17880 [Streptomyces luteireticuli]|uniref:Uncharacterized protein n=1 Tax=Streptomyces luteireticuli TaxID=173858 RepID=A0ABN0YIZ2_9ACTN
MRVTWLATVDARRSVSRQWPWSALDAQWVACKHPAVIYVWPICNASANRTAAVLVYRGKPVV